MNQFKAPTELAEKKQSNTAADEAIKKAADFTFFLDREFLNKLLPGLLAFTGIAIVYIFISHYNVKSIREREDIKKELQDLRSEYITTKSDLMQESKQSELAKRLEAQGVKELRVPPYIIQEEKKK
ncbi:MAG: hypothetical protein H7321_06730 [Bacteroidia bacterium]|nr:hypothetical protein [Bacteroidia bacterium]